MNAGFYGKCMYSFVRNHLFSKVTVPFCILATVSGFLLLHILSRSGGVSARDSGYSNGCIVVCHCCFCLLFPDVSWCEISAHMLTCSLYVLHGEASIKVFGSLFNPTVSSWVQLPVTNPRGGLHVYGGWKRASSCQPPRRKVQTLLPIASWFQSHQGDHNMVKHWLEQHITYIEKRQSKISFNCGCQSPMARVSFSLCCHSGRNLSSPLGRWIM